MKKFVLGFVLGVLVTVGVMVSVLIVNGNLTLTKNESSHTKTVYVDGEIVENSEYTEITGGSLSIDLNEGFTVGK